MDDKLLFPELSADDFSRRFPLRAGNLMWLLGAGASASSGIATAWDMIWEFKQRLFVSQRRVSPHSVADLSSPAVRLQIQAHIDASGSLPAPGDPTEYAALFEAVYPAEVDRQTYIDAKLAGAKPSYAHLALATMMRADLARMVWTTNFDSLVADACAKVYDTTGKLTTVALDAPDLASQSIRAGRWPVEVKLHGDFRSRRLKNTNDELRHQDQQLRQVMIGECRRSGLIVVGYSGRDASIMDALEEALREPSAFPSGLFWLHRGTDAPLARVDKLLNTAVAAGVECCLVRIENFDEVMRDLVRMSPNLDTSVLDAFASERKRWSTPPRIEGKKGFPVVRLNALLVSTHPTVCRRVESNIGGYAEIREAVTKAGVDVLYARSRAGVLAFGRDVDVRKALEAHGVGDFDLHTIEAKRLRYESAERGLLRTALTRAIARQRGMDAIRHRSADLLAPTDVREQSWGALKRLVGTLSGSVPGHSEMQWTEGVEIRLDWADDRLWLLVAPRIVFTGITEQNKSAASDFARERTVRRYNPVLNALIEFWAGVLAGKGDELRALAIGDGIDAVFTLHPTTAFSWRVGA
jgi:hypothetical protein